jgi:hypothetical protein
LSGFEAGCTHNDPLVARVFSSQVAIKPRIDLHSYEFSFGGRRQTERQSQLIAAERFDWIHLDGASSG